MADSVSSAENCSGGQPDSGPPADGAQGVNPSGKEVYRAFCREEACVPLFARDWWLDASVGPDGWNVALVKKNDVIVASMPYVLHRRYGMAVITQPALTPALGPWLRPHSAKATGKIGNEKELMQALIDQLPAFDHFSQAWDYSVRNWQPFFWNGFQQTTYYTYVLKDLSDVGQLWDGLESKVRRAINKARNVYHLQVRDDMPLDDVLTLNRMTFERQGVAPPYSDAFIRSIDDACAEHGCARSFVAIDPQGVQHAACYIVWDQHSAYSLIAGSNPALRASAATSLCLWASMEHAAKVTRQYNFSGSMMEPFEQFLRTFGGVQMPYFHLTKTPSRLLRLRRELRSLLAKK